MARTALLANTFLSRDRQGAVALNTLWNLLSIAAPLPVALVAVPILIRGLGAERFGLLALAWTLIGYFSLFDLGLGRALTKTVAQASACEAPAIFWTALTLMAILGVAGGAILAAFSSREFRLVAAAIPTVTLTAGLRGYLEARQRFALLGPIRAATGVLLLLGPVLGLPSFPAILASILIVRILSLTAHFAACLYVTPTLWTRREFRRALIAPLAKFGGWLTVSNLISPLMVSMDRFLIAAQLSAAAVAWYATPYEVATKFLLLPAALVGVLFPLFSRGADPLVRAGSPEPALRLKPISGIDPHRLYRGSLQALAVVLLPLTAATILIAKPALALWVGPDMAGHSYRVLQILMLGVFINSLAQIPFSYIQGAGRPDLTAKFHLAEFPLYAAALWYAIRAWGIEGAALAWAGRILLDAIMLLAVVATMSPRLSGQQRQIAHNPVPV